MSTSFTPSHNKRNNQKMKFSNNLDKTSNSNISNNRRIESAKINYPSFNHNILNKDKNKVTFNDFSNNMSSMNNSTSIPKSKIERPIWKYSYYIDKNDILNINNDPEIRSLLNNNYKDFEKNYKPITYSWTKPRMIKIIENNKIIEEEVKSNFWKYSYLFQDNLIKPPGKLLKLMVNQLTSGYGNEFSYMKINKNGISIDNDKNLRNKLFHDQHWRHPGVYKNVKNEYEPIKIKRGK
jgi:hypothetical protein